MDKSITGTVITIPGETVAALAYEQKKEEYKADALCPHVYLHISLTGKKVIMECGRKRECMVCQFSKHNKWEAEMENKGLSFHGEQSWGTVMPGEHRLRVSVFTQVQTVVARCEKWPHFCAALHECLNTHTSWEAVAK